MTEPTWRRDWPKALALLLLMLATGLNDVRF
jgi:hypothetical protein